jgi:hypothetical protein
MFTGGNFYYEKKADDISIHSACVRLRMDGEPYFRSLGCAGHIG